MNDRQQSVLRRLGGSAAAIKVALASYNWLPRVGPHGGLDDVFRRHCRSRTSWPRARRAQWATELSILETPEASLPVRIVVALEARWSNARSPEEKASVVRLIRCWKDEGASPFLCQYTSQSAAARVYDTAMEIADAARSSQKMGDAVELLVRQMELREIGLAVASTFAAFAARGDLGVVDRHIATIWTTADDTLQWDRQQGSLLSTTANAEHWATVQQDLAAIGEATVVRPRDIEMALFGQQVANRN